MRNVFAALTLFALTAHAVGPTAPVDLLPAWKDDRDRDNDGPLADFRFISYFFTRATVSNVFGDPSGLRGVSLGPIGSPIGSAALTNDSANFYVDQRWIPVVEYTPFFFDGLATLRAQFEVDFMWGLAANAVQPNQGGGFNADMVNFQTKNINVAIYPFKKQKPLAIVIGTQSFYDAILDPATSSLNDVIRQGYKLAYLGTDATGLAAYGNMGMHRFKLAVMPMQAAQAQRATTGNPALYFSTLATVDYAIQPFPGTHFGVSAWWLHDETRGSGFTYEGLVFAGPGSNGLYGYTGAPKFNIEQPNGNVWFTGFNFNHNLNFAHGPLAASGYVMGNFGHYGSTRSNTTMNKALDIAGVGANLEVIYNWGRSSNDVISLEGQFSSGDPNPADGKYSGVFTLNNYGLPGSVWFNHKTLLLFPFAQTINNYTGAVTDISNQGFGVTAAILAAAWDLIPQSLNLKLGAATGFSNFAPNDIAGRGTYIGTEVNAEIKWTIRYLLTVGLHGAYLFRGSFYDGVTRVAANPWTMFTTFTWYGF